MQLAKYIFGEPLSKLASKISNDITDETLRIIQSQNNVIEACKQATINATKVAAVMAEAVSMVRDGVLDACDVDRYVEDALKNNNVKMSTLTNSSYTESPGSIVDGPSGKTGLDPLTRTLRELGER